MVLDALMDGIESFETMRGCGNGPLHGLALIDAGEVVEAITTLLADGLVKAYEERPRDDEIMLVPVAEPSSETIRSYWFLPTADGKQAWRDGEHVLDAYYAENPIPGL